MGGKIKIVHTFGNPELDEEYKTYMDAPNLDATVDANITVEEAVRLFIKQQVAGKEKDILTKLTTNPAGFVIRSGICGSKSHYLSGHLRGEVILPDTPINLLPDKFILEDPPKTLPLYIVKPEITVSLGMGNPDIDNYREKTPIFDVTVYTDLTLPEAIGCLIERQAGMVRDRLNGILEDPAGYMVRSTINGQFDEQEVWFGDEIKKDIKLYNLPLRFVRRGTYPEKLPIYLENGCVI